MLRLRTQVSTSMQLAPGRKQEPSQLKLMADAEPPFADVSTHCHALDILNCGPLLVVPCFEEHERLLGQVRAYMDAVRPDIERIVNAFGLSVKFVDIEWPNTSGHTSVGCGLSGLHNQREAF